MIRDNESTENQNVENETEKNEVEMKRAHERDESQMGGVVGGDGLGEPPKEKKVPKPELAQEALELEGPSQSASASSISSDQPDDGSKKIYHVKWVGWNDKKCPIVMQNVNGPCPLLSIVNVLLLRRTRSLPEGVDVISSEQLMQLVGDALINAEKPPRHEDLPNFEQNVDDAMAILPNLQTGLDVNVKFTEGIAGFEYTSTCTIFDLLNISLYHGWLCDPQQNEVLDALGSHGYDQLVEMIITNNSSHDSDLVGKALIAQQFLEESASQLTYHGLCELNSKLKDEELAVFFRNNHFSTIHKHKSELFLLVTDQGFLKEPRVVWETLSSIDGDGQFVDEHFLTVPPKSEPIRDHATATENNVTTSNMDPDQQINHDHMLAMTLAEEDKNFSKRNQDWETYKEQNLGYKNLTDEELAKRLQEEGGLAAAAVAEPEQPANPQDQQQITEGQVQQPGASTPAATSGATRHTSRHGGKSCTIL